MQPKNTFLMLALSGSILMMMLVSVLFSMPTPWGLQANISPKQVYAETIRPIMHEIGAFPVSSQDSEEVLRIIQEYVVGNDVDSAKKLYNELYASEQNIDSTMEGEVVNEA
jgi:hypothetical protein